MSKVSKTARASMVGGQAVKTDPFDTNEKKIRELRNQRQNHLAINRFDFIDALIEEYDKALARIDSLTQTFCGPQSPETGGAADAAGDHAS